VTKHRYLLLIDLQRERLAAPEAEAALLAAMARWKPAFQAVEKAHYGVAICQKFIRMGLPLKELIADKDKITRSKSAEVMMENGKIYFRENLPGLVDLEDELQLFPRGQYDDQVDTLSYAALLVANAGIQAADVVRQHNAPPVVAGPVDFARPRRVGWNAVSG
jgi:predicted phage terminase large subunit-like protein